MYEVALVPVLIAGIANVVLGMIWYHPKVFGTTWMRLVNAPQGVSTQNMIIATVVAFLAALVMAYVLAYFGIAWGVFDWIGAIELAFWVWLGFTAVPLLGMVLWERKSITAYCIVAGYWLVSLVVMALIFISWV